LHLSQNGDFIVITSKFIFKNNYYDIMKIKVAEKVGQVLLILKEPSSSA
jgi:hypothetical protein